MNTTKNLISETVLKCPHCGVEQKVVMPPTGIRITHECQFCFEMMVVKEAGHTPEVQMQHQNTPEIYIG